MRRIDLKTLILALALIAQSPALMAASSAEPITLEIAGTAAPLELTPAALNHFERVYIPVPATEHAPAATYAGIKLLDVLVGAKVPFGKAIRGQYLSWVVVVDAADNYRAAFSLAELDPAFNDHLVLLADTRDDKPLPSDEGPFRLVVPDEKRAARWVRQVKRITVGPACLSK